MPDAAAGRSNVFLFLILLTASAGCAPSRLRLPTGPGVPFPDYQPVFTQALSNCSQVRTLEFLLALSGESGGRRLRGRVRAALAPPASARLEGIAPFGQPVFYLVSTPNETTLWLTREGRVVRGDDPAAILEALVGIPLGPDDLRAVVDGCFVADPRPVGARRHGDWIVVDLEQGATAYLRTIEGEPRIVAGVRGDVRVEYSGHMGGLPRRIRVTTFHPAGGREPITDLVADLSQLNVNVALAPTVFALRVPEGVNPMSLEELRASGPLREATTKE